MPKPPKIHALIPSAGVGARAGGEGPKQYQHVAGQPLVLHTLAALAAVPQLDTLLLVTTLGSTLPLEVSSGIAALSARLAIQKQPECRIQAVDCGGDTRRDSVLNGLRWLAENGAKPHDWVLVHDAARCLVQPLHVQTLITACSSDSVGGLLAVPLADTLKQAETGGSDAGTPMARSEQTLDRTAKWLAQTPQMFRLADLQKALSAKPDATDEASALEALGLKPLLVLGSRRNFKVTYPEDFALAAALLA